MHARLARTNASPGELQPSLAQHSKTASLLRGPHGHPHSAASPNAGDRNGRFSIRSLLRAGGQISAHRFAIDPQLARNSSPRSYTIGQAVNRCVQAHVEDIGHSTCPIEPVCSKSHGLFCFPKVPVKSRRTTPDRFLRPRAIGRIASLESIAKSVGVTDHHLARAFGAVTGQSLMRYVRGRRLTEAARSLAKQFDPMTGTGPIELWVPVEN
jgi:AraC-like DNA-binding protein